jgi:hypothetical protein
MLCSAERSSKKLEGLSPRRQVLANWWKVGECGLAQQAEAAFKVPTDCAVRNLG